MRLFASNARTPRSTLRWARLDRPPRPLDFRVARPAPRQLPDSREPAWPERMPRLQRFLALVSSPRKKRTA